MKEKKEIEYGDKTKINKSLILYVISFIPYLFIIYSCFFGIDFSFLGSTSREYGVSALIAIFIINCGVCPIYPVLFIFQIIYIIKNYKSFEPKYKKFTKYAFISLIAIFPISLLISWSI